MRATCREPSSSLLVSRAGGQDRPPAVIWEDRMAGQGDQGTGKHPHKSAAEPYPHTKEGGRKEDDRRESHSGSSSQKHEGKSESRGREQGQARGGERSGGSDDDLKSREYTDAQGNVHHHTKTYTEQHKK